MFFILYISDIERGKIKLRISSVRVNTFNYLSYKLLYFIMNLPCISERVFLTKKFEFWGGCLVKKKCINHISLFEISNIIRNYFKCIVSNPQLIIQTKIETNLISHFSSHNDRTDIIYVNWRTPHVPPKIYYYRKSNVVSIPFDQKLQTNQRLMRTCGFGLAFELPNMHISSNYVWKSNVFQVLQLTPHCLPCHVKA